MSVEQLTFGSLEARSDLAHVTGSYIATLATMGAVQLPPVLRAYRPALAFEAPAPVAPPAEVPQPISFAAFQSPQQDPAYAGSVLARTSLALAA